MNMLNEAKNFIQTMYTELNYKPEVITQRLIEVENEINQTGTYYHTQQELEYGAKMAWRNSNRCIGRFYWQSLTVEDARGIEQEDDFINSIENHIVQATNNGKIKPYITIFHPEHPPRIYNNQLIRYAGYTDCGDPAEKEVTRLAEHLGWTSQHTQFDVLPLIYKLPNGVMSYHDYPKEIIKEITIEHEQFPKLKQLGLKWYAVPIISNM